MTRFVGLKKKMKGEYLNVICTGRSVAPERTFSPNFDKIDKMKVK